MQCKPAPVHLLFPAYSLPEMHSESHMVQSNRAPMLTVFFIQTVFDGNDRIFVAEFCPVLDQFFRSILSSIFALFSFSLKSKSIATLHSLRHCPTSNFKRSGLPDATRFLLFHFFSIGLFLVCQIFPSFKQYQIPCSLSRNLIFQTFLYFLFGCYHIKF